ncbi:hypothetical protein LDL08_15930 [Nonomuraea glycinis]|uniref:Uncharacterized protein n=1 Tax=Nonomuraea glycinis TaxID=2047744 RepID=A0A918A485_9ACTN|nr:hypothetical protein [Nonomuraea glycinis]MCA2177678.1 hypothetical protein [Nonomuraea glycinis]GGP06829.1 hypothetical protein GCM10012278_32480 [Nonomuraea glycinis]
MARSRTVRFERSTGAVDSKATRYLCAGVYLDRDFRKMVIRRVYNDSKHMVAPSYGFDLVPVVVHAWRAWRLETLKWMLVLAVLLGGIAWAPAATAAGAALFGLCWSAAVAVRSALVALPLKAKERADRFLRRVRWNSESNDLAAHLRSLKLAWTGSGALVVAVPVISGIAGIPLSQLLQQTAIMGVLTVLVACGCGAAHRGALHQTAKSQLPSPDSHRYRAIDEQQHHTFVIYRRAPKEEPEPENFRDILALDDSHKPFVGAGRLTHRWNPPLNIHLLQIGEGSMADREFDPLPFKAHELVAYLKYEMQRLDGQDDATSLPDFEKADRIYVAEPDVGPERGWLQGAPATGEINEIIDRPFDRFHHFLEIRTSVSGELVTTVFLRTTVKGRALSLDFAACALTRTPDEYHVLDGYGETGVIAILRAAVRALTELPTDIMQSWRLIHVPATLLGALRARRARVLYPKRGVKIGAKLSVREEKRMSWETAQLDRTLISDHVKLVEDRLLKAATEFLREKKVDISEFEERATNIINTGIMNFGESMNVNNSAVGTNAVRLDLPENFGSSSGGGHT